MAKGNAVHIRNRTTTTAAIASVRIIYDTATKLVTLEPHTFPIGSLRTVGVSCLEFAQPVGEGGAPPGIPQATQPATQPARTRKPMSAATKEKLRLAQLNRLAGTKQEQHITAARTRRTRANQKTMTAGAEGA